MKGSCYARFCEGKFPKKFQKRIEGFASVADTVQEEMFRAGFYCGLHINDVCPDPDRPVLDDGYILVRKEAFRLAWDKADKEEHKVQKAFNDAIKRQDKRCLHRGKKNGRKRER